MDKLKPIRRPSVSEQVCEQLKGQLLEGRWKPGEKIPSENELAQAFGVSRVSVREALTRLSSLGLLESRFGGGNYVREFTAGVNMSALLPAAYLDTRSVLEVIEFRQVVEVKTAGLAARRATPADLDGLEAILAEMHRVQGMQQEFAEADLRFHLELARITRNSLLIETMNIIRSILSQTMQYVIRQRGHTQGLSYHRLLIDAIAGHDEKMTMRIMEEHIDDLYRDMAGALEAAGEEAAAEEPAAE